MTVNPRLLIAAAAAAVVSLGLSWGSTPSTSPTLVPGFCAVESDGWMYCTPPTFVGGFTGYTLQGDAARVPLVLGATAIAFGLRRRRTALMRVGLVVAAVGLVPRTEIDPNTGQAGRIV